MKLKFVTLENILLLISKKRVDLQFKIELKERVQFQSYYMHSLIKSSIIEVQK